MTTFKKGLKIAAISFAVLLLIALAAPFLFKGKIIKLAKEKINESLTAKVDFADIDISFIRHFPKVAISVEDLQVVGTGAFAKDTLLAARSIDVAVNFNSLFSGKKYKIYSIAIDEPRIHAVVSSDGKANWDITKPDTTATSSPTDSSSFQLALQHYAIKKGFIKYDDEVANMHLSIINLNHEGSGDFSSDLFTLKTATTTDAINFTYAAIPYLANVKTSLDADIEVDNKTNTYRFKTDDIHLNALTLATEGLFQLVNDSTYNMDIAFKAPSTEFKDLLSLVPAIYQHDFNNVKTSGKAVFNGYVKGRYSAIELPAYALNLAIENGFFQYPDLPKPLQNINLALQIENADGVADHTVVNISKGHIEMDNAPFDFHLLVKNPVSQLFIDAAAKGSLNLSKVTEFAKMDAGTKLTGLLNADVAVKGTMEALQKQQYENFQAAGTMELKDFLYASKDYPDGVALKHLLLTFNPKNVTLNNINGKYLNTSFAGSGVLNNLLPYMLKNQPLDGQLTVKADHLNLNDWMGVSTDTAVSTTATTTSAPFLVPNNIHFGINAQVGKVHYDKVDLENLSGNLRLADETVHLQNVTANALDGSMAISGSYSTKIDKQHPDISLTYDVKGLNIEKTFNAFNTVQKLMPIGQFLSGKMSSQLTMTGKLGENMMPDLNSLTGQGNLLLLEGVLKKFAPVEGLARTLNIKELETITLKEIKNHISFANGKVAIKPFKLKVKDIDMEIGGMHGLDQSLAYGLNMKVPRALMGDKGNQLVNNLVMQANKKGIPAKVSEVVDLNVKVGGTLLKPTYQTDLKQAGTDLAADIKQQTLDFVQQKADSTKTAVKTAVKDTLQSVKNQVVQAAANELKNKLLGKDTTNSSNTDTKTNLKETGKGLIEGFNPFKKKKKEAESQQ
jgi:hypothetical protein